MYYMHQIKRRRLKKRIVKIEHKDIRNDLQKAAETVEQYFSPERKKISQDFTKEIDKIMQELEDQANSIDDFDQFYDESLMEDREGLTDADRATLLQSKMDFVPAEPLVYPSSPPDDWDELYNRAEALISHLNPEQNIVSPSKCMKDPLTMDSDQLEDLETVLPILEEDLNEEDAEDLMVVLDHHSLTVSPAKTLEEELLDWQIARGRTTNLPMQLLTPLPRSPGMSMYGNLPSPTEKELEDFAQDQESQHKSDQTMFDTWEHADLNDPDNPLTRTPRPRRPKPPTGRVTRRHLAKIKKEEEEQKDMIEKSRSMLKLGRGKSGKRLRF